MGAYEKAKQLAKISKRLDELKERLEGGNLKVDDIVDQAVEYKVLKKMYQELLYSQDMAGSLGERAMSTSGAEYPGSSEAGGE